MFHVNTWSGQFSLCWCSDSPVKGPGLIVMYVDSCPWDSILYDDADLQLISFPIASEYHFTYDKSTFFPILVMLGPPGRGQVIRE